MLRIVSFSGLFICVENARHERTHGNLIETLSAPSNIAASERSGVYATKSSGLYSHSLSDDEKKRPPLTKKDAVWIKTFAEFHDRSWHRPSEDLGNRSEIMQSTARRYCDKHRRNRHPKARSETFIRRTLTDTEAISTPKKA